MSNKIKSYKLSPQLRSELNFSKKNSSSQIFNFNQVSFQPNLGNIPWRGILIAIGVCAVVTAGWLGVKKGYEYTAKKNEAQQVAQLNAYNQRIENIKKEVSSSSADAYSLVTASQQYLKNKDVERSEAAAELATTKDPAWRDAFVNLGQVYLATNKFDKAKSSFEQALKIDPISGQAHYLLSLAEQELKNTEAAKAAFAKAKQFGFQTDIGG